MNSSEGKSKLSVASAEVQVKVLVMPRKQNVTNGRTETASGTNNLIWPQTSVTRVSGYVKDEWWERKELQRLPFAIYVAVYIVTSFLIIVNRNLFETLV